ncbi:MAG: GAF domain-containing protein [Betaproteobacteria bacterium]|nr:GAF domain-containing protein [Betaproteobacteria bacterium]
MFEARPIATADKPAHYRELHAQLKSLLEGERDPIANMANFSSLVFTLLPDLNWAGFYLMRGDDLVLGPFQGKPACVRIPVRPMPRGVCGACAAQRKTQVVHDVHEFPGHIACDSASNSEIVMPLVVAGKLIGVVDVDSPSVGRFDDEDRVGLEAMVATLVAMTDFHAEAAVAA